MWNEAEKVLSKDKYLASLLKKWGHCAIKPRVHKDYFQSLCNEIIGQQLSGRVADIISERFKKALKGKIIPEAILKIDGQALRDSGMSWGKVSFIKDLAGKVSSNKLQVTRLNKLPDEEVIKELVAVKGIGRWTAEMFLMFSLARPDIFPIDDLGIKKGVEKLIKKRLEGPALAKFGERWKPYRTVASWYIWRSLENR